MLLQVFNNKKTRIQIFLLSMQAIHPIFSSFSDISTSNNCYYLDYTYTS